MPIQLATEVISEANVLLHRCHCPPSTLLMRPFYRYWAPVPAIFCPFRLRR